MTNILVVDDDDSYVYLFRRQVQSFKKDISVNSCATGQEALDYLKDSGDKDKIPDLLFLDLNMPVMNGFDFLEEFSKICESKKVKLPPPAIWIVTSSDTQSDHERARLFSIARGFLVKPLGKKKIEDLLVQSGA